MKLTVPIHSEILIVVDESHPSGDEPVVSVIIATYNYAAFLPHALASIREQTMTSWECIVVDDASTDDTATVLEDWASRDPRFRPIVQPSNRGPSAARNRGLSQARGHFIQFLDADDLLQLRKLDFHSAFLERHPEVDVVYGEVRFFRSETPDRLMASLHGRLSAPHISPVSGQGQALVELLVHHNLMPINAAMIRRSTFDRVGTFEESMRGCEDWDFFLRCAILGCRFEFATASDALALVRSHSTSASRDQMRLLSGLAAGADRFRLTAAGQAWQHAALPPVYEAAVGIRDVQNRRRREGARRLQLAASEARRPLLKLRWSTYALAARLLPIALFRWLVSRPMPELPIECWRRLERAVEALRASRPFREPNA